MIGGNLWNKKYVSKKTGKNIDDMLPVVSDIFSTGEKKKFTYTDISVERFSNRYNTGDSFMTISDDIIYIGLNTEPTAETEEEMYRAYIPQTFRIDLTQAHVVELLTSGSLSINQLNEGYIKAPYNFIYSPNADLILSNVDLQWVAALKKIDPDYYVFGGYTVDTGGVLHPISVQFDGDGTEYIKFEIQVIGVV